MLSFLSNGNLFYVAAALCLIGAVGKWLASQRYKKLIKQGEALGNAKDKQLRQIKGRFENACRMNGTVPNVEAFVDKSLMNYHYLWTSLEKVDRLGRQMGIFLLFLGGACAYFGYRAGLDVPTAMNQLYIGGGMAALLFLWDMLLDTSEKRRVLGMVLRDYFENSLGSSLNFRREEEMVSDREIGLPADGEKLSERGRNDMEYLKQSLDRIAASREDIKEDGARHKLTAEEEHIIKEIIREYLA
jgi:hypothetical protein